MEFNLRKEYLSQKISDKDKKSNSTIFISAKYNKLYDKFNFDGIFSKPLSLYFDDCSIQNFYFKNILGGNNLKINEITFDDVIFLESKNSPFIDNSDFCYNDKYNKLNKLEIRYLNKDVEINAKLSFFNFKIGNFNINNRTLSNKESFKLANEDGYFFQRERSYIKEIKIYNPIDLNNFNISNIKIGTLRLENIYCPFNSFQLNDLEIKNLVIKNSNLSNASFNGLNITKLTLLNSNIQDCTFNGVEFVSYELGNEIVEEERIRKKIYNINTQQLKDNYRQLKFVMDKNGNHTEANKFFAKEMEYYEKSIEYTGDSNWSTIKDLIKSGFYGENAKNIGEIIILKFSKIINEFGNNWLSPLFLLIFLASAATFFDGLVSTSETKELFKAIGTFILAGILLIIGNKYKVVKIIALNEYISKISQNIYLLSLALIFSILGFFLDGFDFLQAFSIYINPVGMLPEYVPINGDRIYITYSGFEQLIFVLYRIIYGIILWHLIVAAKRTTKR